MSSSDATCCFVSRQKKNLIHHLLCRPLVAGTSEGDQLDRIFRLLGTPTIQDYPGIVDLPDYSREQFPPYPPPRGGLGSLVPTLDPTGVDLLSQMLQYDPARRVTAQAALQHPFFDEMKGTR
jgi:serine/threonine protein kinase